MWRLNRHGCKVVFLLKSLLDLVKTKYCKLLKQISTPPAEVEPMPKYTPAADSVVGFVVELVHEVLPQVMRFVVNVELVNL